MSFGDAFFGISWLDIIIRTLIVVIAMTVVVIYLTYGERKVVARFQMRLGPTRTGPAGLLQGVADALKLVVKEDLRPRNADRWVFEFAPYATFVPVFLVLLTLPFAENWGVRNLALGMFFVFVKHYLPLPRQRPTALCLNPEEGLVIDRISDKK